MATIVKGEPRRLTLRQQKGRAVNAVAEVLRKKLLVPNIYLEPHPHFPAADVLAVDRAGAGDLHAVRIKLEAEIVRKHASAALDSRRWMRLDAKMMMKTMNQQLMRMAAHYRYLAIPRDIWDALKEEPEVFSYSSDGIGRIGIISITDQREGLPSAEIVVTPERFRVDAAKLTKIEKNLINNKKVRPDIEVRI
jgi:hypothetical protein